MAEPFKNVFNPVLVRAVARHLARTGPFDQDRFIHQATKGLESLELKARSHQIADALEACLPSDFPSACDQMLAALHPLEDRAGWVDGDLSEGLRGWAMLPMGEYVARRGQGHFDLSMNVLRQFTPRMSAEFDIRPFLAADLDRGLSHVRGWVQDEDEHVRRLASEGTRPRLPWGMQLKALIFDPTPILPILTALRDDPSEYVRRSVANNLNDIAKDHPDLVADLARDWLQGASPQREKLVRHACRTLIKDGHPGALAAFGYAPPELRAQLSVSPDTARMGKTVTLKLELTSVGTAPQNLVLDYVVHFMRANGRSSAKVFKWTRLVLHPGQTASLTKTHSLREVTTRRHYPGVHKVEAQINGKVVGSGTFTLL